MIPRRRIVLPLLLGPVLLMLGAGAADAHPLGNFTVNHYDGLVLHPDRVDDLAVVDTAEIPTLQDRRVVDQNGDSRTDEAERADHAERTCTALAAGISARAGGRTLRWTLISSRFDYRSGAAGLDVSRLECRLSAPARLTRATGLTFTDGFQADRIGWHEITAAGRGVHLRESPVPTTSTSDELRSYPNDLLSSPLDVRSAELSILPGAGLSTSSGVTDLTVAGPITRRLNVLSTHFTDLAGARTLTPTIGLLAVLLSLVLGASHALLPGHGKTVIAAYLAGRRGSIRDALTVGATVTITHTAGVIVLGLLLSGVAALAGETVLAYLGIASGLLIAVIGAWLLITALHRRQTDEAHDHHRHDDQRHDDHPDPDDARRHDHHAHQGTDDGHPHDRRDRDTVITLSEVDGVQVLRIADAPALAATRPAPPGPDPHSTAPSHEPGHGPGHGRGQEHGHGHGHGPSLLNRPTGDHGALGRATLIGMGIAGGLVPSPSALIVLLGAIGLGRTWFGILLVIGYGIGMAATLTTVGLLLVRLRARLDDATLSRFSASGHRLALIIPVLTALLVLLVGVGLTVRAAAPLLF